MKALAMVLGLAFPPHEALRSSTDGLEGAKHSGHGLNRRLAFVDESIAWVRAAGPTDVGVRLTSDDLDSMESSTDPLYQRLLEVLLLGSKSSDQVVSAELTAMRPKVRIGCCY